MKQFVLALANLPEDVAKRVIEAREDHRGLSEVLDLFVAELSHGPHVPLTALDAKELGLLGHLDIEVPEDFLHVLEGGGLGGQYDHHGELLVLLHVFGGELHLFEVDLPLADIAEVEQLLLPVL